jgi:putative membrane protein
MKISFAACCAPVLLTVAVAAMPLFAQDTASDADKAFVGKVSQGGRYEVEASQLDVKDLAYSEVHDHQLVNQELKTISAADHVPIAPALNAELQQKLAHLRSLSGKDFDTAYLDEMSTIHDKDEKLFAQEAADGGAGNYKAFAAKTDLIVKRHIGALHGTDKN